jgi:hypothetical protein
MKFRPSRHWDDGRGDQEGNPLQEDWNGEVDFYCVRNALVVATSVIPYSAEKIEVCL